MKGNGRMAYPTEWARQETKKGSMWKEILCKVWIRSFWMKTIEEKFMILKKI